MVDVAYIASPLLDREQSTLTILANDRLITSVQPVADGTEHHFSLAIPVDQLQGAGVTLHFQGYLRLTDLPCEVSNNPAQWLTILDQTSLTLTAGTNTAVPDLADLPQAIVVENALDTPPPVIFILPDDPDEVTLTTAAQVAARLGAGSRGSFASFGAETVSTLTETQKKTANLVIVGLPQEQVLIKEMRQALPADLVHDNFVTADNIIVPPEHGVIQIFNSPWNDARTVLLVSAAQKAGLALTGRAFADQVTFQSLRDSFHFVRALESRAEPIPTRAWLTPQTTFAQLNDRDRTVVGTGLHREFYFFRRPPGWVLDNGSQLTLHLGFSSALQASESYVAAFINDVHIGTVPIGRGIKQSYFTFDLPVALLNQTPLGERPQTMTLRLEVVNSLIENACEQSDPETAWTQIFADSFFVTPHVYLPLPDLQAFPYPFVSEQPTAPTAIILPPQPNTQELSSALSIAATLGRFAPTDFELHLLTVERVSAKTQRDANLIVLGSRQRQPLIGEFLTKMGPIPGYREEQGLYQHLKSQNDGLLREGPSPWNDERVALLVFGVSEPGFQNAAETLFDAAPPVAQPGSVAVVQPEQPPQIIYRAIDAVPEREPGQVQREPLIAPPSSWAVATGVLLLTTLAVLGTIWVSRRRGVRQQTK